jgi:hypothetical protein
VNKSFNVSCSEQYDQEGGLPRVGTQNFLGLGAGLVKILLLFKGLKTERAAHTPLRKA